MTTLSLIRGMLTTILFFITIYTKVTSGDASVRGSIDHPCDDYTFTNCNPEQALTKAVFATESIEQCQERCSDPKYQDKCKFFIFSSKNAKWNCILVNQRMQDYLDQCNVIGGRPKPSIDQCIESDDLCKMFVITMAYKTMVKLE